MRWLHEHGVISNLQDYNALSLGVLQDCALLMNAEAQAREMANRGH